MPTIRGGHLGTKSYSSSDIEEALWIFLKWLSLAQNGSMCLLYLALKSLFRSNLIKYNEKLQAFFQWWILWILVVNLYGYTGKSVPKQDGGFELKEKAFLNWLVVISSCLKYQCWLNIVLRCENRHLLIISIIWNQRERGAEKSKPWGHPHCGGGYTGDPPQENMSLKTCLVLLINNKFLRSR